MLTNMAMRPPSNEALESLAVKMTHHLDATASNFDEWRENLSETLKHLSLLPLLGGKTEEDTDPFAGLFATKTTGDRLPTPRKASNDLLDFDPNKSDSDEDDHDDEIMARRFVKYLIKDTTIAFHPRMIEAGWKSNASHPRSHLKAVLRAVNATGRGFRLMQELAHHDRTKCLTLAGYQHRLVMIRRSLLNLGLIRSNDKMMVFFGVNGLREANVRWYNKLVKEMAIGGLKWGTLMERMSEKALRETTPAATPVKATFEGTPRQENL